MEFNITKLEQFDLLFADFIQKQLGLEDDQVLLAYTEKGQPNQRITTDRIYVHTEQELDERRIYKNRKQTETEDGKIKIEQYTMRTLCLNIIVYGPRSDILVNSLNSLVYTDTAKRFFYDNNLALIPDRTSYQSNIHEVINERWWHRADLKLYFYNSTSIVDTVDTIETFDIKLYTEKGEI